MNTKICPKCESEDIDYKPTAWQAKMGSPPNYKCNNCGHESQFFPEIEKK